MEVPRPGSPSTVTVTGADDRIRLAIDDAGAGITRPVPLTPAALAQLEALASEYPYFGMNDDVQIAPDYDRLAEFADRYPYMAVEQ